MAGFSVSTHRGLFLFQLTGQFLFLRSFRQKACGVRYAEATPRKSIQGEDRTAAPTYTAQQVKPAALTRHLFYSRPNSHQVCEPAASLKLRGWIPPYDTRCYQTPRMLASSGLPSPCTSESIVFPAKKNGACAKRVLRYAPETVTYVKFLFWISEKKLLLTLSINIKTY